MKDPYQLKNLATLPESKEQLQLFRNLLAEKMKNLNDTFPKSKWYKKHWIRRRIIKKTATLYSERNIKDL